MISMGELEDVIREELDKKLKAALAAAPWWCLICGEGGNYEGERPDEFWFPPEDHVCPPMVFKAEGFKSEQDIEFLDFVDEITINKSTDKLFLTQRQINKLIAAGFDLENPPREIINVGDIGDVDGTNGTSEGSNT